MAEEPTSFVDLDDDPEPTNNVADSVVNLGLTMSQDFRIALAVATDAQAFRFANSPQPEARSVTRSSALIGCMVAEPRVRELGQESGLDWALFEERAGLSSWVQPSEPGPLTDAAFNERALHAIDFYAGEFGGSRPRLDSLGLCWALIADMRDLFYERLRKAGSKPDVFQSLLREMIDSEDEEPVSSAGKQGDRRTREPDRRPPEKDVDSSRGTYDRVRTLTDAPAVVDLLNRKPLAESLATRFRSIREDDPSTSFLLHVDGPWGAGKSTLLNFLRDELESDSLVVYFNAWREQRAIPPWWGLLGSLRRAAIEDGGWRFRVREALTRLKALGRRFWIVAVAAVAVTIAFFAWATSGVYELSAFGSAAASLAPIVALGGTIWAVTDRLGRSRVPGSLVAAAKYVAKQDDPMQGVSDHFNQVVRLVEKPVVIFVDDLDRCSTSYVVEFLEAVQTLIRDDLRSSEQSSSADDDSEVTRNAPYFVIAADGRWIRTSYEKEYSDFAQAVAYPGRSVGYLFLEKAFQLTTTLPAIDLDLRRSYWEILLGTQTSKDTTDGLEAAALIARSALEGANTDTEVLDRVEAQGQDDPFLRSAFRGEAVRVMARAEVHSATEHALRPYAELLDPNPRAMKRFVNAYSVERALRTIEARRPEVDQLARWTIVQLRWPQLADMLRDEPDLVVFVGSDPGALLDSDRAKLSSVLHLLVHPDVVRTITDADPKYGQPLNSEGIIESAGL